MGIGQQIKGMVDRAKHYWAELTDEKDSHRHAQAEREDSLHQRYGGVRSQDESASGTGPQDRTISAQDTGHSDVGRSTPAQRSGQAAQMGAPAAGDRQMQGAGQTQRQYTQQGGSGIQKTLGEQLGGSEGESDKPRSSQSRRPGQQNH